MNGNVCFGDSLYCMYSSIVSLCLEIVIFNLYSFFYLEFRDLFYIFFKLFLHCWIEPANIVLFVVVVIRINTLFHIR